jgi:hypothetical protein
MVPDGKLIDAIPHRIGLADVVRQAPDYDLAVLHTSTPSFSSDVRVVGALKAANPRLKVGFVGDKVAVEPQSSLQSSPAIDFVATEIFQSADEFYRRFYFRAPKIASIMGEMVRSPQVMTRRLREGVEFFSFLRGRRELAH